MNAQVEIKTNSILKLLPGPASESRAIPTSLARDSVEFVQSVDTSQQSHRVCAHLIDLTVRYGARRRSENFIHQVSWFVGFVLMDDIRTVKNLAEARKWTGPIGETSHSHRICETPASAVAFRPVNENFDDHFPFHHPTLLCQSVLLYIGYPISIEASDALVTRSVLQVFMGADDYLVSSGSRARVLYLNSIIKATSASAI
ncbi:hypothetical protein EVAR_55861_1 [Eumeta japonica]|uniref:Uncharacterized protein n=1 Tax=Eumeta variegata TaxID=151549 RepID=A0A4C1Z5N0_EUMVA|nr:hypothetical protein EVAR_55861_1 [Eumeta japonica]